MPSINDNLSTWEDAEGAWWDQGDEWSGEWGGAASQWHSSLLPRLRGFLPAGRLVEIAPGFGRWTQFLLPNCDRYTGVDLTPRCVAACQERFAEEKHATFHVNDGVSMPMVADRDVDFLFSFDSLVHVEMDVLEGYVKELARVLADDGVAFIHHSNAGEQQRALMRSKWFIERQARIPDPVKKGLTTAGLLDRDHWRAKTPTAAKFAALCDRAGLQCIGQELVPWGVRRILLDSLSLVTRPGSKWSMPNQVVENWDFMPAAHSAAAAARVYPDASGQRKA